MVSHHRSSALDKKKNMLFVFDHVLLDPIRRLITQRLGQRAEGDTRSSWWLCSLMGSALGSPGPGPPRHHAGGS